MKKTLYTSIILTFFAVILLPLFFMLADSFFKNGALSLSYYQVAFNEASIFLLLRSAALALGVSVLATSTGGFLAFILTKTDLPLRHYFKPMLLIPLFLSPYLLAVAWVDFFNMVSFGKSFILSSAGMIFILSLIYAPLAMLIISSALANLDASQEEAGLMQSSYQTVVRKIVLPLSKPAIISSIILIFILSISEFAVPVYLAVPFFTREIFTQFSAFYNYNLAAAHSVILTLFCLSLLLLERFYLTDAPFLSLGSRGQRTRFMELQRAKHPLVMAILAYLLLSVLVPLFVLCIQTFKDGFHSMSRAFSLLAASLGNSLLLAAAGALLLLVFGFILAYFSERDRGSFMNLPLLFAFCIPSTVLGIALIKFFNRPYLNFLYSGFGIILIGYLGRFTFIAERIIANGLKQIPCSLEESAEILGAPFLLRVRKIVLPLLAEGLFSAFLIGFIFSLGELGTTILVYPPGTSLVQIKVFTIMANAPLGLSSAMSLIVLLSTLAMLTLFIAGKKFLKRTQLTWMEGLI